MGRADRWWNEHFPPYSWARLAFGIVAIPFIGLLWYPLNGETFTWGRYIAITLMTQAFLAVTYPFIRARRDEIELDKTGTITWKTDDPPVPWELPRRDEMQPREAKQPSELEREAMAGLSLAKKKPRTQPHIDFIVSFAISWAAFSMTLILMLEESVGIVGIAMSAIVALLFTVTLTFRYSVAALIGVSAILGLPAAYIGRAFFYVLSWFSDPGSIWIWWPLCSLGIFSFFAPGWYALRRNRHKIERLRIPNWVTTSLVSMFLVVSAAMASASVSSDPGTTASPRFTPPPMEPAGAVAANFGAATQDEALLRLYFAWRNTDPAAGRQVAHPQNVDALFALPFDSSFRTLGCGVDASGVPLCVIRRTNDLLVFNVFTTDEGRFYLAFFESKPLDHPIDYSQGATPAATPTP
ncbi:MAG: hypothetical protein ACRDKT_07095 [Actinomycetota bacterium]